MDPNTLNTHDVELREQDRWLPIANVARLMKNTLPPSAKVSKDAKECMQECVSEYISFVTSEASDRCLREKRKTINGEDILYSMHDLGFENYAEVLKIYLAKYREQQALKQERGETRSSKRQAKQQLLAQQAQEQQVNQDSASASITGVSDEGSSVETGLDEEMGVVASPARDPELYEASTFIDHQPQQEQDNLDGTAINDGNDNEIGYTDIDRPKNMNDEEINSPTSYFSDFKESEVGQEQFESSLAEDEHIQDHINGEDDHDPQLGQQQKQGQASASDSNNIESNNQADEFKISDNELPQIGYDSFTNEESQVIDHNASNDTSNDANELSSNKDNNEVKIEDDITKQLTNNDEPDIDTLAAGINNDNDYF